MLSSFSAEMQTKITLAIAKLETGEIKRTEIRKQYNDVLKQIKRTEDNIAKLKRNYRGWGLVDIDCLAAVYSALTRYNNETFKHQKLIDALNTLRQNYETLAKNHERERAYQYVLSNAKRTKKYVNRECEECGTMLTTKEWPKGELCPVCYPSGHLDI